MNECVAKHAIHLFSFTVQPGKWLQTPTQAVVVAEVTVAAVAATINVKETVLDVELPQLLLVIKV